MAGVALIAGLANNIAHLVTTLGHETDRHCDSSIATD